MQTSWLHQNGSNKENGNGISAKCGIKKDVNESKLIVKNITANWTKVSKRINLT